ncbi:hypothetical protein IWW48_003247 [Coemansia sp. RSA 1200]|nr:hypothetical protein IWW48_003247 [Coemansia sp. RSA 1200]
MSRAAVYSASSSRRCTVSNTVGNKAEVFWRNSTEIEPANGSVAPNIDSEETALSLTTSPTHKHSESGSTTTNDEPIDTKDLNEKPEFCFNPPPDGVLSGSCMATLGVVSGKLCERFGYRPWHLLLTQGVLCGTGAAFTFLPAVVIPSQWFEKRRGLATGTVNLGIGVGGIVWTQFNHILIKRISVAWTLRLTAAIVLVTCSISIILIKSFSQSTAKPKHVGWSEMKNNRLILFMACSFFTGTASLTPFYYLPGYAKDIGISTTAGSLITSIANAASLVGRLIATVSSDFFGPLAILLWAYTFAIIAVLAIWTTTGNFAGTMAFGIVFGLGYGAIFTQTSTFVAKYFGKYSSNLTSVNTLPVFVGLYYTVAGVGYLFGPPVAGVILEKSRSWGAPYTALKIYTGIPLVIACVAIVLIRFNVKQKRRSLLAFTETRN